MSLGISGLYSSAGVHTVSPTYRSRASRSTDTFDAVAAAEGLKEFHGRLATHLRQLSVTHGELEALRASTRVRKSATVSFQSDDLTASAATRSTLTSTEEINTTATSYDERGEVFDGGSTSVPTVGGTYDGSLGTQTLEFRVHRDRTVGGSKNVRLNVYDQSGSYLEKIVWNGGTPPDTDKTSSFGITVSLSAGDVEKNDTFFLDVYDTVGTDIDVDDPFDGVRSDHPEIEDGFTISDGSFDLNGTTIAVNADDTLQDVIDRVNAAGAGATLALVGDQLVFTADEVGAEEITVDNDSSGFLDAMKLSAATVSYGDPSGEDTVIQDVDALDGVSSGTFSINGTSFSVDIGNDTFSQVLDDINAAGLGVTATLDESGRFVLSAGSSSMTLDDGTSNFFSALNIQVGTHQGRRGRQVTAEEAHALTDKLDELAQGFQAMFEELERGPDSVADAYRDSIASAVASYFQDRNGNTTAQFGLLIDFESEGLVFELDSDARRDFFDALMTDQADTFAFLLGDEDVVGQETGLLDALLKRLEALDDSLGSATSYQGLLVSTYA